MLLFLDYIPPESIPYCSHLAEKYDFEFILKKNRSTKLGDFRRKPGDSPFIISVNNNLNPFQFLLTFIHELAHLKVALEHPAKTKAHGSEWKKAFQVLLAPVLNSTVFPEPLLSVLERHMHNPKAAAGSDPKLWTALKSFNQENQALTLNTLEDGSYFIFRKKQFVRIQKRRTRVLCKEVKSKRLYLIPEIADIEIV